MVSTCCQRVVGCCVCVQRWISRRNRCPHCSADKGLAQLKELKGLEMLTAARVLNGDSEVHESVSEQHPQYELIEESSDDDFATPRICMFSMCNLTEQVGGTLKLSSDYIHTPNNAQYIAACQRCAYVCMHARVCASVYVYVCMHTCICDRIWENPAYSKFYDFLVI